MAINLESIQTGRERKPPRLVFYGPMGIGKTTWAASAPNPIFVQCEDGIGKLEYARFPTARSFADVMECFTVLYRGRHQYQTVVLDSISWLEQIVHSEIRKEKGDDIFASFGRGYKLAEPYFERVLKALDALRNDRGMLVVLLGHSDIERYDSPDIEPYDRYSLKCHDLIQDMIFEWADAMLFGNYRVFTQTDELGFNQKRVRGLGNGQRVIYTEERPSHKAKNRFDLPYELPFPKQFDWDAFLQYTDWRPEQGKQEQFASEV
jgi:hypothetical protein